MQDVTRSLGEFHLEARAIFIAPDGRRLVRQDDNGNRSIVAFFNSKEEAAKTMAFYEGKGHKQTYWIEFSEAI